MPQNFLNMLRQRTTQALRLWLHEEIPRHLVFRHQTSHESFCYTIHWETLCRYPVRCSGGLWDHTEVILTVTHQPASAGSSKSRKTYHCVRVCQKEIWTEQVHRYTVHQNYKNAGIVPLGAHTHKSHQVQHVVFTKSSQISQQQSSENNKELQRGHKDRRTTGCLTGMLHSSLCVFLCVCISLCVCVYVCAYILCLCVQAHSVLSEHLEGRCGHLTQDVTLTLELTNWLGWVVSKPPRSAIFSSTVLETLHLDFMWQ